MTAAFQTQNKNLSIESMVAYAMEKSEKNEIVFQATLSPDEEEELSTIPQDLKDKVADRQAKLEQMKKETSKLSLGVFRS